MSEFLTRNSLLPRLVLAVSMTGVAGLLAGCKPIKDASQSVVKTRITEQNNHDAALATLGRLGDNTQGLKQVNNAFGIMCQNVRLQTSDNYYTPATSLEPACEDWARDTNVKPLGMQRAVEDFAYFNKADPSQRAINEFLDTVNRVLPPSPAAAANP